MRTEHYLEKVRKCRRVFWYESGVSLRTLKRNKPHRVDGYLVRHVSPNRFVVVADFVLEDKIALIGLANRSKGSKLEGWLYRNRDEIHGIGFTGES